MRDLILQLSKSSIYSTKPKRVCTFRPSAKRYSLTTLSSAFKIMSGNTLNTATSQSI
ncbi:hypothetical protein GP975_25745 [Escherichia coli]|uniref:Uncharacterized protein n=1 Tax=Escherichia coli TaxID=562 RepID=A0A8T5ZM14_ECOLX|nr:hypothetical protein [Escherichia coli]